MRELIVIAGLSGAGRTTASNVLDDLGGWVIDNLPLPMLAALAGVDIDRVALVMGRDAAAPEAGRASLGPDVVSAGPDTTAHGPTLGDSVRELRAAGVRVRMVFLEASDEVLIRRYEGTRRRHPLAEHEAVAIGIEREREVLAPIKELADKVIDTTDRNVHEFRDELLSLFAEPGDRNLVITVESFGFKHGAPSDVDLLFDVRFLPNPHWDPALRPLTGLDGPVRSYVLDSDLARTFLAKLDDLLQFLLPGYEAEGRSYLSIGIGCTGGQHRSVAIAEALARLLTDHGHPPILRHHHLERR